MSVTKVVWDCTGKVSSLTEFVEKTTHQGTFYLRRRETAQRSVIVTVRCRKRSVKVEYPLMGTLKPRSNGPLYRTTVIGKLAVDGWAVTFITARRGLGGLRPRPVPSSQYQM